jgi:hypothetical protein
LTAVTDGKGGSQGQRALCVVLVIQGDLRARV